MKEHKVSAILNLISSILFGIVAFMNFNDGNENTMGFVYVGLCMTFLGLSISNFEKWRKRKNK